MDVDVIKVNKCNQLRYGWENVSDGMIIYVLIDEQKKQFYCPNNINENVDDDFYYGFII